MVRQDKIAYFTTFFEGEGWIVHFPNKDTLSCLVDIILFNHITSNETNVLLSKYRTWEKVADTPLIHFKNTLLAEGFDEKKAKTILELLKWSKRTFGEYSLSDLNDWSSEKIITELTSIAGIEDNQVYVMLSGSLRRNVLPVDAEAVRVIARMGIVPRHLPLMQMFDLVNSYIPIGRSYFLFNNWKKFANEICNAENPSCKKCTVSDHCDYHLKKNDWSIA